MKNSSSKASFKVTCPNCGNTLGVMEDEILTVRKKGRVVRMTVWDEAEIVCEECGTTAVFNRYRSGTKWNGMVDSREWEKKE